MATATFGGTYTANGRQDYASGTVDLTPYGGSTTTVTLDGVGTYSASITLVLTSTTGLWLNDAGVVVTSRPAAGSQLIAPGGTVSRGWVSVTETLDGVPSKSYVLRATDGQVIDTGRDVGTVLAGTSGGAVASVNGRSGAVTGVVDVGGHAPNSIPAAAGSSSLADLAVPASTFVARLAAGNLRAATAVEAKALLDVGQGDVSGLTAALATKALATDLAAETTARSLGDTTLVANTQTGNYTTVLADAGKAVEYNSASPGNVTIPPNASVPYPTGTIMEFPQIGAGAATLVPGAAVTITGDTVTPGQGGSLLLRKTGTNAWWGSITSFRSGTFAETQTPGTRMVAVDAAAPLPLGRSILRGLGPAGLRVHGLNLVPQPVTPGGAGTDWKTLYHDWPWTAWVKKQVDYAKSAGANCIRLIGDYLGTVDGTNTISGYVAKYEQFVAYCESQGLLVYAVGGEGRSATIGQQSAIEANLVAMATMLDRYDNVIGFDISQEISGYWLNNGNTRAQVLLDCARFYAAVKAVTTIPLTFSAVSDITPWNASTGMWADTAARSDFASVCDYWDFHVYYEFERGDAAPLFLDPTLDRPVIIGEWGPGGTTGNDNRVRIFAKIQQLLLPETTGGLAWAVQDQSTTITSGLWDNSWSRHEDYAGSFEIVAGAAGLSRLAYAPTSSTRVDSSRVVGDSANRWHRTADGGEAFGPGNAVTDTNGWSRGAAAIIQTSSQVRVNRPSADHSLATAQAYSEYVDGDSTPRAMQFADGWRELGSGSTTRDVAYGRLSADLLGLAAGDSFQLDGTWNGGHLLLGSYHVWTDASGAIRVKSGVPASDLDGVALEGKESVYGLPASVGEANFNPFWAVGSPGLSSGQVRLTYWQAKRSGTYTQAQMFTGATAAAATPTLIKMATYSVDLSTGALTRLAVTASDTTLFAATNTNYPKAYSGGNLTVTRGSWYADAVLLVTGAATPLLVGNSPQSALAASRFNASNYGGAPRSVAQLAGQTDMPASITAASLTNSGGFYYMEHLV